MDDRAKSLAHVFALELRRTRIVTDVAPGDRRPRRRCCPHCGLPQ